ncbi:succinate--CoA ligase subunit alpha [Candidatus Saccharibacteria bacterium RIFCSPHIGHO2_01_FULL_45_15]|nr:MAG: succinate--CoA ligase subunit alpha [Candidatus Saccharibacteria bacterium RIFCSPHIGHO2_01_FULL_45_15]OGL27152.1 MAG: succinate--CoA ligase subunit alpha [Candidatus Saccharibacteria bacterium RIFCSPHIGHO2_02_FULL_46_12]OGL32809.1 MAG: succinate--CoA ligase subunit alpha [Candidatus Saccharibacteria bacterium RIFCSPHIGHO2_12_FULL_44_22]
MTEDLLSAKNVIVQGITGAHGAFHASAMKASGTNVVAGTSPSKIGDTIDGIPVYGSIKDIQAAHAVDISVVFVPARFAKGALIEAITAEVPLIVCITEGIPLHDMLAVTKALKEKGRSQLIGPNCPGILLPGGNKLGIIPAHLSLAGSVGVVSRSGTLTYEAMDGLTRRGIGQKYIIGIGGDRIAGTSFIDCLRLFENDPDVDKIVMIGEIGGTGELDAAKYIKQHVTKPVYAYVTGHHAPAGVQLGHAGAILGSADESAAAKTEYLAENGVHTATSITHLIHMI